MLGSVHAFSRVVHAANIYRPRFQVRTRPSYCTSYATFPCSQRRKGVGTPRTPAGFSNLQLNKHGNDSFFWRAVETDFLIAVHRAN